MADVARTVVVSAAAGTAEEAAPFDNPTLPREAREVAAVTKTRCGPPPYDREVDGLIQVGPRPLGFLLGHGLLHGGDDRHVLVIFVGDENLLLHRSGRPLVLHVLVIIFLLPSLAGRGGEVTVVLVGLKISDLPDRPSRLVLPR
jgi:hypothetical protein